MTKQNDKKKTIEEQLGINKNEILWLQYSVDSKLKYLVTSDKFRDTYYLYEVVSQSFQIKICEIRRIIIRSRIRACRFIYVDVYDLYLTNNDQ